MIVSEPFADLPGAWQEIPQGTAVCVLPGGALEEHPFVPRVEADDAPPAGADSTASAATTTA